MALFSANPVRSAATAAAIVSVAHFGTKLLSSIYAFQTTQTLISILSIGALLFMIMMHHRSEGQMLTQSQEEMAVIGVFALFWVVVLLWWQSRGGSGSGIMGRVADLGSVSRGNPCGADDAHCYYEEYYDYW